MLEPTKSRIATRPNSNLDGLVQQHHRWTISGKILLLLGGLFYASQAMAIDPYAKAVVYANILNGNIGNSHNDPSRALGPSDGLHVSLGGPGASLILDMGAETPVLDGPGPDLQVLEIGAAHGGADESYDVLISSSTDTNTFVYVGRGRAMSLLDIHGTGLTSARYVWIQDLATESLNSTSPGSDIDSVRVLHYSGGGDDEVAPPTEVGVRLTGQGVWVSWVASTNANTTGYAVRRSLDGITYGSSPDAAVTAEETAWHDLNPPVVGTVYYAVSALVGNTESILVTGATPSARQIDLLTNGVVHVGDTVVSTWDEPTPQRQVTFSFTLSGNVGGPNAELDFEIFNTDFTANPVLVNGGKVAGLPAQVQHTWVPKTLRFATGGFRPGLNTLTLLPRNSSGGTTGDLDDFQIRNISLRLYDGAAGPGVITGARFTEIVPGQTNVTLRWVVEQTPGLSPVQWETVSSPIEWTGLVEHTNGFYRLRDVP